ncbi:Guanine nucleotide-binding protein subunit alpha [Hondaea fermentalgiana]|uniref:Guanine nucleotide-binding protein subunit alpha n=1 Tax=Hondaea fermentalgiana TaxID=2315210 RepID=A0A2R5GGP6_9STRA|nr:Guanine nucleotide-binding protein subunit alpha [Hondaea fermentalgiana]|eukprot:GBG27441.1 Guanine nucleotide-binding protein subunit alpha [Hondaea fermentalgiana]
MGGGASRKKHSQMAADMLLLGAPSVGKSTIFRQMKLLYRGGFTDKERRRSRIELRRNLLASVLKLDEIALQKGFNLESQEVEEAITQIKLTIQDYTYHERDDDNCLEAREESESVSQDETNEVQMFEEPVPFPAQQVKAVMEDNAIKQALALVTSGEFKAAEGDVAGIELMQEALPYVAVEHFDRIVSDDFVPTDQDCLHLRRHTTSVERIEFPCEISMHGKKAEVQCSCTDIGGQAQEQKKWESQASKIDFVIFVAAMSDFDRTRTGGENSLNYQFSLLERLLAANCFRNKNVIVLLNKVDALEAKLQTTELRTFFPEFEGKNDVKDAQAFFEQMCVALNDRMASEGKASASRQIQVVPTCALDTHMLHNVISSALAATLMSTLVEVGIV